MDRYIDLRDSDIEEDVPVQVPTVCVTLNSDSEEEQTNTRRSTRRKTTRQASKTSSRKKKSQNTVLLDTDSNSNNSTDAVIDSQIRKTLKRKSPLKENSILPLGLLDPPCIDALECPNPQPDEVTAKKNISDSDSDSDDGKPVVKKPTKSRTIRRGLSRKTTPLTENQVTVTPQDSTIYSTCVSHCMGALRNGSMDVPAELIDSDVEEDEFISKSKISLDKSESHTESLDRSSRSLKGDDSVLTARGSPSPPPSPEEKIYDPSQALTNINQKVRNALRFLHSTEPAVEPVVCVEPEPVINVDDFSESDREVIVKVRSRSGIHRFPMNNIEPFKRVFEEMAQLEDVKEDQIVMFRREESIRPSDTPLLLKLHVADIIDCRIAVEKNGLESSFVDEDSYITIIVQGHGRKSKTSVKMKKGEPVSKGLEEYCREQKQTVLSMKFLFDGEPINTSRTPDELEMEDEDCLDAVPL